MVGPVAFVFSIRPHRYAVRELHVLPWYTTYLHYPVGTTLLGHTLNPFNGLLAIALLPVLTLVQTYNSIVIF